MTLPDNLRGASLMMVAMAAFTINDAFMKSLAGSVPLMQAIFLRGILTSALVGLVAWRLGRLDLRFRGRDRWLVVLRCVAEAAAAYFFLTALFNMPISSLTAILQALPLTVALAAAIFLGEPIGWRRLTAICIGFVGVLLIVQPGMEGFTIFALYGLATVACATVRDIATRRLSQATDSLAVTFLTALAVALLALLASPGEVWVRPSLMESLILVSASLLILVAYLTIIMAMRVGEIAFVAPFRYAGLVTALIVGTLFFGERPDALTLLGASIVVATGLYTILRERRMSRPGATA